MTQPPAAGPTPPPGPGWSGADEIHDGLPPAPAEPGTGGRGVRRSLLVAGATAGVLVLGGTGFAVATYVSGGGAQPEEVLPADTLAVVKLDLDPAAGQKMAVSSLLDRFPSLTSGEDDDDLRGTLVTPLLADNEWGLTYEQDVEPWLGNRMAVAAVPDPASEAGVAGVVVLAVTDEAAMTERLEAVPDGAFAFAVRDDFVLLGEDQEPVDRLAAGGGTLAEDDALEVQGLIRGTAPTTSTAATEPTTLAAGLPADTVAALSVSGLGEALTTSWATLQESGIPPEFEDEIEALGLDLPDDLGALLGTDLAVAVTGDLAAPQFGARVRTDDPQRATEVIDRVAGDAELPVAVSPLDDGYVLASDPALADALAADGGLGDSAAFQAAVADPDDAGTIGFVDLGSLIDEVVAQGGDDAAQAQQYAALGALGFSASTTDDGGRFVLRITTR